MEHENYVKKTTSKENVMIIYLAHSRAVCLVFWFQFVLFTYQFRVCNVCRFFDARFVLPLINALLTQTTGILHAVHTICIS